MRPPRMTTRRWMIVVAVVVAAMVMGGVVGVRRLEQRRAGFLDRAQYHAEEKTRLTEMVDLDRRYLDLAVVSQELEKSHRDELLKRLGFTLEDLKGLVDAAPAGGELGRGDCPPRSDGLQVRARHPLPLAPRRARPAGTGMRRPPES